MSTSSPVAGARILVVEDEYLIAAMIVGVLDGLGCVTRGPCGRLADALRLAQTELLDGALLDRNLGGQEVFPVARALRDRNVPFTFISGYDNSHLPAEWLSYGKIDKPFRGDDIERCVASLVARSQARR